MTLQDLMMLYGVTLGKRRTAKQKYPVSYTHLDVYKRQEAHGVRRTGTDTHSAADALGMVGRFRHIHVHLAGSGAFPAGDALILVHLHLEEGHPVEQRVECAKRAEMCIRDSTSSWTRNALKASHTVST